MKTLTRRQHEFLSKLLDLYYQENRPVHYSTVAERLGVGKVTAYEMLRLLEARGLVEAEYRRPEDMDGPGRACVVFKPSRHATRTLIDLAEGKWREDAWEQAKARILTQLRTSKASEYDSLLDELLKRLPRLHSPSEYLAQMVAAIALGLHSLKGMAEARAIRKAIRKIGLPGELDLSALAGLGAGLTLVDRVNQRLANILLVQAKKFQTSLSQLNTENRRRLAEFTREVMEIVGV